LTSIFLGEKTEWDLAGKCEYT